MRARTFEAGIVAKGRFVGDAANPPAPDLRVGCHGGGYFLSNRNPFTTGSLVADRMRPAFLDDRQLVFAHIDANLSSFLSGR
jgi:hypothetical protein